MTAGLQTFYDPKFLGPSFIRFVHIQLVIFFEKITKTCLCIFALCGTAFVALGSSGDYFFRAYTITCGFSRC